MRKSFLKTSLVAGVSMLTFSVVGLTSCGKATTISPATVRFNVETLKMSVNEVKQIKASVSKGYTGEIRWFSSNPSVVTVDDGYCFGISAGEAIVTAAFGGGFADCVVTVEDGGGSGEVEKLFISLTTRTVQVGTSFKITHNVYPTNTEVIYTSENPSVATVSAVTGGAQVNAISAGETRIKAEAPAIGKVAYGTVIVTADEPSTEEDIAVSSNLNYTGELVIGSPELQTEFMSSLLNDFNRLTNSNIKFTITKFEEDNGTTGFPKASAMPAVYPYASDQTLTLFQFQALSPVGTTDRKWIKDNMGDAAANAAKLGANTVGYPFAADNGLVMYYNTDYYNADQAFNLTIDEIFDKADAEDLDVNYPIGNGFYGGPALMTFNKGVSMYRLTPTTTAYSSESNFNSDEGLKAAKMINKIANRSAIRNAVTRPDGDTLITITDVSKVQTFKKQLGNKYACAPLPYVDATRTTRLSSFLGYKFYGVNASLNQTDKEHAAAVAKFLCSEYAQTKRFKQFYVRPTLSTLDDLAITEQHVAALVEQQRCNSTIPLVATASELWSATATAVIAIRDLAPTSGGTIPDSAYQTILAQLDSELNK